MRLKATGDACDFADLIRRRLVHEFMWPALVSKAAFAGDHRITETDFDQVSTLSGEQIGRIDLQSCFYCRQ